jgi:hypothetical protein
MFQIPITIADAVRQIERRQLLLPAIQREFVWQPDQIETIWDSLMRGFPIGGFLFWRMPEALAGDVRLYDFFTDFHVRDTHNVEFKPEPNTELLAVLDGQQRLTALNIGLRGSYRSKLPRMHWSNDAAFPKTVLCLRLDGEPAEPDAEGKEYDFAFHTAEALQQRTAAGELWFPVPDARKMRPEDLDYVEWLQERDRAGDVTASRRLHKLVTVVHTTSTVSHYLVESDSLDEVLDIFIRANSGGTQLSFSDLLLSLAVAEFQTLDARKEINDLQDEMNLSGDFRFGRDRILKASLVLADLDNIKFRAENFHSNNMQLIENKWPDIRENVLLAVKLIARLGFDAGSFRAENALIPVAYFLMDRECGTSILDGDAYVEDRKTIHRWLASSFLKSGYWTGAVDGILLGSRKAIQDTTGAFPLDQIEDEVESRTSKSSQFTEEDVDELLEEASYPKWRAAVALSVLFGRLSGETGSSIDHLHPQAAFTKKAGEARKLSAPQLETQRIHMNRLPNLQLTYLVQNQEKGKKPLEDWLASFEADEQALRRTDYVVDGLPLSIDDFDEFYEGRREKIRSRLMTRLGVS